MKFSEMVKSFSTTEDKVSLSDGSLTTDRGLLSLRRQARLISERKEKERLKAVLRHDSRSEDRKAFKTSTRKEGKTILSKLPGDKSKKFMSAKSTIFS